MRGDPMADNLTYCTVRIECADANDDRWYGTGFFYGFGHDGKGRSLPGIVTNRHVMEGAVTAYLTFTLAGGKGERLFGNNQVIALGNINDVVVYHPDADVDLCAFPIGQILQEFTPRGMYFHHAQATKELLPSAEDWATFSPMEEILMIGYPDGLRDDANNMPIARRGITATHPRIDYNGDKEFMIDIACFGGSSGSPVFLYNPDFNTAYFKSRGNSRILLLGVLYAGPVVTAKGEIKVETVPTSRRHYSQTKVFMNLGYVIKAHRIAELEATMLKRYPEAN